MYKPIFLSVIFFLFIVNVHAQKFDTTVLINKIGYRVVCSNKDADNNTVVVTPVNFNNSAQTMQYILQGKVKKASIDDFNGDGFPDLIFYAYDARNIVKVYALISSENKSCLPVYIKDIYDNPKLRQGYYGHDEFSIIEGLLYRTFPLYKITDTATNAMQIVGKRIIEYKATFDNEKSIYNFNVINTYDIKQ